MDGWMDGCTYVYLVYACSYLNMCVYDGYMYVMYGRWYTRRALVRMYIQACVCRERYIAKRTDRHVEREQRQPYANIMQPAACYTAIHSCHMYQPYQHSQLPDY